MFNPYYDSLPAGAYQTFVSRPDLSPPLINVNGSGTPGLIFFNQIGDDVRQEGIFVTDHNGDIVYVNNTIYNPADVDIQFYNGQKYLTYWSGKHKYRHGSGDYFMMDDTLNIVQNFTIDHDSKGDIHEFKIINDTALYTFYYPLAMNLTKWGGPPDGYVTASGFRHIDLKRGKTLLEWRSSDHISPNDSLVKPGGHFGDGTGEQDGGTGPWDYFHLNSVDMHPSDGTSNMTKADPYH